VITILIAAHRDLGPALLRAAEGVVGPMPAVEALALGPDVPPERVAERLATVVGGLGEGDGVLVLTDMFGGTPTNQSLPFLQPDRVEVLTGVNLPMVLKAHTAREEMGLGELASFLRDYGCRNVVLASELWGGRH
jgi:PTS system mannose-specific IIA component